MWNLVLNVLFPRYCAGCKHIGTYVCFDCRSKLRVCHNHACIVCHKANVLGITHINCRRRYGVDAALGTLHYNNMLKRIIAQIKYHGYLEACQDLLHILKPLFKDHVVHLQSVHLIDGQTVITPIPLHSARLRARGFNQAQIVADALGDIAQLPVCTLLKRTKHTEQLAKLPHNHTRTEAVKGAFSFIGQTVPRCVLLVDDVVTTGSTAREATKILKQNGVERVVVFSLAR